MSLKALADAHLKRNSTRNNSATDTLKGAQQMAEKQSENGSFCCAVKPGVAVSILDANQPGNDHPPANHPTILAEAWTPSAITLTVEARDQEHADWLRKVNPKPEPTTYSDKVMCQDCQHAIATTHPMLIRCGVGVPSGGAAGWWRADRHPCDLFQAVTA